MKLYVTMTDSFLSGWGLAEGKTNKLVLECDSLEEAKIVVGNAKRRGDMKYISIRKEKPNYSPARKYLVQYKTKKDYPKWYEEGYFK